MGMGPRRAALPQRLILALLVAPALLSGCREPETYVELGPSFAPVVPPPGRAQVYVYWPAGSPPVRGAYHLWGSLFEQLLPGGYVSEPVAPGEVRVGVGRTWKLGRDGDLTSAGVPGPELAFRAEARTMARDTAEPKAEPRQRTAEPRAEPKAEPGPRAGEAPAIPASPAVADRPEEGRGRRRWWIWLLAAVAAVLVVYLMAHRG